MSLLGQVIPQGANYSYFFHLILPRILHTIMTLINYPNIGAN